MDGTELLTETTPAYMVKLESAVNNENTETYDDSSGNNGHLMELELKNKIDSINHSNLPIDGSSNEDNILQFTSHLDDKSKMLVTAWNNLYSLLGNYKAELISRQTTITKCEGIGDVQQLRLELVNKETELEHLKSELSRVTEILQQNEERSSLDSSVKDSLIDKYREDLLHKDSVIITSTTKINRLESHIRTLESRQRASNMTLSESVKRTRPFLRRGGISRSVRFPSSTNFVGHSQNSLNQTSTSRHQEFGNISARSIKSSLDMANAFSKPANKARSQHQLHLHQTPTPKKNSIVCIEVDNDAEIQEVENAANVEIKEELNTTTTGTIDDASTDVEYLEQWTESERQRFQSPELVPTTSSRTVSNSALTYSIDPSMLSESDDLHGTFLPLESQAVYPGMLDEHGNPWPIEMQALTSPSKSLSKRSVPSSPSTKSGAVCEYCGKYFVNMSNKCQHVKVVHLNIKTKICDLCGKRFGHKSGLDNHMVVHHKQLYNFDKAHTTDLYKTPI